MEEKPVKLKAVLIQIAFFYNIKFITIQVTSKAEHFEVLLNTLKNPNLYVVRMFVLPYFEKKI